MHEPVLSQAQRESLGALLRGVYARFTAQAQEDPQAREFVLLDTLADQDADSQQELAERLGINRTIMVRLVDTLEERGYLTRTRNPANRRSYILSITEEGRAARDAMRAAVADRDARVTAPLSPVERELLNKLLAQLLPEPEPVPTTAYLVAQAYYRLRRIGDSLLSDLGLRTRHLGFLAAVETLGPCPQQALAQHLGITEPAAAQIAEELVQLGLISRGQDPHDRRRYALELTPLGRDRMYPVRDAAQQIQSEIVTMLGADATRDLKSLLTRLL